MTLTDDADAGIKQEVGRLSQFAWIHWDRRAEMINHTEASMCRKFFIPI